mmetsp:Transcript_14912/g.24589  ORF Transcript_14912/g.24589 Transcript_14912/m.24589 type:complete len:221 (-) Transcript_14912:220-882(-)
MVQCQALNVSSGGSSKSTSSRRHHSSRPGASVTGKKRSWRRMCGASRVAFTKRSCTHASLAARPSRLRHRKVRTCASSSHRDALPSTHSSRLARSSRRSPSRSRAVLPLSCAGRFQKPRANAAVKASLEVNDPAFGRAACCCSTSTSCRACSKVAAFALHCARSKAMSRGLPSFSSVAPSRSKTLFMLSRPSGASCSARAADVSWLGKTRAPSTVTKRTS